jgi:hypothetical protein
MDPGLIFLGFFLGICVLLVIWALAFMRQKNQELYEREVVALFRRRKLTRKEIAEAAAHEFIDKYLEEDTLWGKTKRAFRSLFKITEDGDAATHPPEYQMSDWAQEPVATEWEPCQIENLLPADHPLQTASSHGIAIGYAAEAQSEEHQLAHQQALYGAQQTPNAHLSPAALIPANPEAVVDMYSGQLMDCYGNPIATNTGHDYNCECDDCQNNQMLRDEHGHPNACGCPTCRQTRAKKRERLRIPRKRTFDRFEFMNEE